MESRCAMAIAFCLLLFGNCFLVIVFLLIAFCLLLFSFAHQNVEMRNFFSIDNNVKFGVIPDTDLRQSYLQMIGYAKK